MSIRPRVPASDSRLLLSPAGAETRCLSMLSDDVEIPVAPPLGILERDEVDAGNLVEFGEHRNGMGHRVSVLADARCPSAHAIE